MLTADRAIVALASFIHSGIERRLEPTRLAKAGWAMLRAGCSRQGQIPGPLLASYLLSQQRDDGGWADVEETAWCLAYLASCDDRFTSTGELATSWIRSQRLDGGGWGRTGRDRPRIPILGLLCALASETVDLDSRILVAHEWRTDLSGPAPLTYKGAFFLLTQPDQSRADSGELIERTVAFLTGQQQDDGGFAPWKGHPVGSDPWSTGVVLWGLAKVADMVPVTLFESAAVWLRRTQLPDGNWPYHYLDEGTSIALIGLSSIQPFLKE